MKKRFAALFFALLLLSPETPVRAETEELCLPVVMYHHISTNPKRWNDYVVSLEEFAGDLEYLSAHGWHSVSVRELLSWYAGEFEMPEKPFMLTFDDGFESTLAYAEPLLEEYGFCGVAAVIGAVCDQFTQCGEHDPELSNLSWEDAAAMASRGVIEVQCHTWNMHELYPRQGCQKKRGESLAAYQAALTADLKQFLRKCDEYGVALAPSIAYPYGAFCDKTEEIAQAEGFRVGFTCNEHINILQTGDEDILRLGRFNRPHGPGSEKFFADWETAFSLVSTEGPAGNPSGFPAGPSAQSGTTIFLQCILDIFANAIYTLH